MQLPSGELTCFEKEQGRHCSWGMNEHGDKVKELRLGKGAGDHTVLSPIGHCYFFGLCTCTCL